MITIELPWPDKRLNPNSRCHWREKAEAARQARAIGSLFTKQQRQYPGEIVNLKPSYFEASYMFCPPDTGRRDIDNLHSQEKNYADGICDELGIDDSRIKRTVLEWGEVVKGGKVVLRLKEMK